MGIEQVIGLFLALLVMSIGLLGCLLPGLPSTPFILAAAVGHRLYFGQASVGNLGLILLVAIALFSLALDYFGSLLGAKKLGATWRGAVGAVLGVIAGLFFGPPGIVLGPFLGALAFELIGGREFEDAARAGVGAVLGLLIGAVGKLASCLAMIGLFTISVISRSATNF